MSQMITSNGTHNVIKVLLNNIVIICYEMKYPLTVDKRSKAGYIYNILLKMKKFFDSN